MSEEYELFVKIFAKAFGTVLKAGYGVLVEMENKKYLVYCIEDAVRIEAYSKRDFEDRKMQKLLQKKIITYLRLFLKTMLMTSFILIKQLMAQYHHQFILKKILIKFLLLLHFLFQIFMMIII